MKQTYNLIVKYSSCNLYKNEAREWVFLSVLITILLFTGYHTSNGQDGISLSIEIGNATCEDNGSISVVPQLPSGSSVTGSKYSLYLLSNLVTPYIENNTGQFIDLFPGEFQVVYTGEIDGVSISVVENAVVLSEREPLRFTLQSEAVCDTGGKLLASVTSGIATFFELKGEINRGPQTDPSFENLPPGSYTITAFDACGDSFVQNYTISPPHLAIIPGTQTFKQFLPGCSSIRVGHGIDFTLGSTAFPLNLFFTIYNTDGSVLDTIEKIAIEGDLEEGILYVDLPFTPGRSYTYDLEVSDQCGNSSEVVGALIDQRPQIRADMLWGAGLCGNRRISIKPDNMLPPFNLNFEEFPEGFDPAFFNTKYPGPFVEDNIYFGDETMPVPDGLYRISIEDNCGNTDTIEFLHRTVITRPFETVLAACTPGHASVEIMNFDYLIQSVRILDGPDEFRITYPDDVSEFISRIDPRRFLLGEIPSGTYTFEFKTSCGNEFTHTYNINGVEVIRNDVEVIENCGTFDIALDHIDDRPSNQPLQFGLQKFFPENGQWGHPETGRVYNEGALIDGNNSIILRNNGRNLNFGFDGEFRIVKMLRVYSNGNMVSGNTSFTHCLSILHEFTFNGRAVINDINSFACGDDRYDVYLNAAPYEPITYSIVSVDGVPVDISNGTNPLFTNLAEGRYQFRITDRCGNSSTFTLPLYGDNVPVITPTNLCENEEGSLSVPLLQGVSYEWYHTDNPETILSNSHTLTFSPFNVATHSGIYSVRLSHENTESCINRELTFDIDPDQVDGNAGTGLEATACAGDIINLFDYLEGPFGNYGRWNSVDNRAEIIGSTFDTEGYGPGLYQFEYTIVGLCAGEETSIVSLTLTEAVDPPTGSPIQEYCGNDEPTIADLTADGSNIVWYSTPQGLASLDITTPLVDGQTYYAEQVIDGCPSVERFPVVANIYPEISNFSISGGQEVFQIEQPTILTGDMPEGGKTPYLYQWQISTDGENWSNLEDGKEKDYTPEPLMETSHFRRITYDGLCSEAVSNSVSIVVNIAPIAANDDAYGPLKGFESHVLPVLTNDLFMGSPAEGSDLSAEIIRITNLEGVAAQLPASFNESGGLVLAEGSQPGTYLIEYQICQSLILGNCDRAVAQVWVGQIAFDMEKVVDSTRAIAGEMLSYTFVITNNSPFAINDIRVTDLLPEGLVFLSANAPPQGPGLVWLIDSMGEGEEFLLTFDVMAAEDGRYTNTIEVTAADFRQSVQSQEVIVRPRESDVSISHEIMEGPVADGEELIYWITVTNFGIDDAFGVTITDQITERLRFLSWSVGANNTGIEPEFMLSGRTPTWQMQTIPTNTSITLEVRTMPVKGGVVEHEAWVRADGNDPNMDNNATTLRKEIQPLFIPNVFKPDNDGKNETFMIRASHKFEKTQLLIFNRWGDTVFQSSDYQNDWNAEGLNAGTYYYQVQGQLETGEEIQYKGWVQVIK